MTKLLEKVITKAEKMPDLEQNALAKWILMELSCEKQWEKTFAESEEALGKLAREALNEHKKGKTKPFDFEHL